MNTTQYEHPYPAPTPPPPRKRHTTRNILLIAGAGLFALVIAGIAMAGTGTGSSPRVNAPATQPAAPPPPPVTSPEAKYRSSGDYIIPASIYGPVLLVGEADLHNTGNVGVTLRCRMNWYREGLAPLTQTRKVRLATGANEVLRFRLRMGSFSGSGSNVIDSVQSWQSSHMGQPVASAKCSIVDSWGPVG